MRTFYPTGGCYLTCVRIGLAGNFYLCGSIDGCCHTGTGFRRMNLSYQGPLVLYLGCPDVRA